MRSWAASSKARRWQAKHFGGSAAMERVAEFHQRLRAFEPMMGTFVKTPSPIVAEVLALSDLDLFCIDVEHAPFGRYELDQCLAIFNALDRPCLVRVANDSPTQIRNALDSGAAGVVVPHVVSADQAAAIVKAAHFGEGGRGYAGSTRAADYTTRPVSDHLAESALQTTVIVQIEDIAALDSVAEIAAVEGVDGLFVGRTDLAVAMGRDVADVNVVSTVGDICRSARSAGKVAGMFTPLLDEIPVWLELGASLFLLSSDQGFVLEGARRLAGIVRRGEP